MPQPAAPRERPGLPPAFLLASTNKKKLFAEYEKSAKAGIISFETFCQQWQIHASEVVIIKPHSDVNYICDKHHEALLWRGGRHPSFAEGSIPVVEVAEAEKPRLLKPMGISADRLHYSNKEIKHYLRSDLLIPWENEE